MPGFDPDKFLADTAPAKGASKPFDPDKFLDETAPVAKVTKDGPTMAGAAMRGVAQGMTANLADEAVGAVGGLSDYVSGKLGLRGDISLSDAYHTRRDSARKADDAAAAAYPKTTTAGQLVGGAGSIILPGMGALNVSKGAGIGQVLAKGAAMGALSGVGSAKEFTDIPADAGEGGVVGAATGGLLHGGGKILGAIANKVGPVAAKMLGGVTESDLAKYLARPQEINAAGAAPKDAVKDVIDQGVAGVLADRDAAAQHVAQLEEHLKGAYGQKKLELQGTETPLAKAKEMTASLTTQKSYLHSLSEQADDALARSGATFQKQDLLKAIDSIAGNAGDAIGDEMHAALAKLQVTRQRIAEQLPDEIPATRMRSTLKQLRKDIDFDQSSGEFNDTLNGMRKDFSSKISAVLKGDSPMTGQKAPWQEEYAGYMARMSGLADNLSTMNRYFGDESRSLGSLESLRKGGPRAQLIEDALQNHASLNGDQSLIQHLDDVKGKQALLGRIKGGEDLRGELFPQHTKDLAEAQANYEMAQAVADPIERLSAARTQSVVQNQGGIRPNTMDARGLDALGNATGNDYHQAISDKNVADKFTKGQEKSGRLAIMGTAVGGGLGYLAGGAHGAALGASVGGTLGGALNPYGPAIVKGTIDSATAIKAALQSTEAVKQLGPYARQLADAAAKGNKTLAIVNQTLLATDPVYRSLFKSNDPNQQKRDAIQRRIGQ